MKRKKHEKNNEILSGTDYSVYRLSAVQKLISTAAGAACGISAFCIFFGASWPALAAGIAGGVAGMHFGRNYFTEKRMKELTGQFRDFLESLSSSFSAGQNFAGAVESALGDMRQLYGEKGMITIETERIADGMRNNMNPEDLLMDFADRSSQKDIRTFAETFCVCHRTGGNMREVIAGTTRVLSEKMQTERETDVIASKGKNELMIMTAMPFIIIPMLRTLGESGVSGNNPVTLAVRCAGAVIIGLSVFAGKKITDIRM